MNTYRGPMTVVARRARAYFAPVQRATGTPAQFDPAVPGPVPANQTDAVWTDLGWIENLKRTPGTKVEAVRAGAKRATVAQFRAALDARVEFEFMQWGKLQMALTGSGQHMNVLAGTGGVTMSAVPVVTSPASTASEVFVTSTSTFSPGDMVAVDVDYTGQAGYVGTGVAGAYVKNGSDVQNDPHYVRRVTFNVARLSDVTEQSLILDQPLIGGAPGLGAKVQRVVAFSDREGGSFFQEWSALFVVESDPGGQVCFYYPRLQAAAAVEESSFEIEAPLKALGLRASLRALPVSDAMDGEQVLCYRTYYPSLVAPAY